MNKITPEVRNHIDTLSKALETYFEFFGTLPNLDIKDDRAELLYIYRDIKYAQERDKRQNSKAGV